MAANHGDNVEPFSLARWEDPPDGLGQDSSMNASCKCKKQGRFWRDRTLGRKFDFGFPHDQKSNGSTQKTKLTKYSGQTLGILAALVILQKMIIDLTKIVLLCAFFNSLPAWAYCTTNQLSFQDAWVERTARKFAAMTLGIDLLVVVLVMCRKGHFKMATKKLNMSLPSNYRRSDIRKMLKFPVKQLKAIKTSCPPDPCPFNCSHASNTATPESLQDSFVTISESSPPKSLWQDQVKSALISEEEFVNFTSNVLDGMTNNEDLERGPVLTHSLHSYIPCGTKFEDDGKLWAIYERQETVVYVKNHQDNLILSETEIKCLQNIANQSPFNSGIDNETVLKNTKNGKGSSQPSASLDRQPTASIFTQPTDKSVGEAERTASLVEYYKKEGGSVKIRSYYLKLLVILSVLIGFVCLLLIPEVQAYLVTIWTGMVDSLKSAKVFAGHYWSWTMNYLRSPLVSLTYFHEILIDILPWQATLVFLANVLLVFVKLMWPISKSSSNPIKSASPKESFMLAYFQKITTYAWNGHLFNSLTNLFERSWRQMSG